MSFHEEDAGAPNILLTPFRVGNVTLRNRIVSTGHSMRYTAGGIPTDRYRRYQEQKAKGGVGLVTIGGSAVVSRESSPAFGNITMYTDEVVPALAAVAASCHQHGSKVFIQLTHLGRRTDDHSSDWLPTVSSVSVREPTHRSYPKQAEDWDLDRIVGDFVAAAERAKAASIDGIELVHFGHLLDAFASPLHLAHLSPDMREAAAQFPGRVIRAVKNVTGEDMALGIRMSVDERRPDGLVPETALALLNDYVGAGIDFVNVIVGTIESQARMADVIPGVGKPSAPFLEIVGEIKRKVSIPVIHAGKIDIATAEYAVSYGLLDLVGMTRANIADPYLVSKIEQGRTEDIRPCVGANYCLEGGTTGGVVCFNNPAVGREEFLKHEIEDRARSGKRVVIVGAGPAGLEAAQVAAKRGHEVTVFEAAAEPGGQMGIISRLERKREFAGTIDWRVAQARQHGVKFQFGVSADKMDVLDLNPDTVILATGGTPRQARDVGIAGSQLVESSWKVFDQPHLEHYRTLLFDDEGRYASLDALELLAKTSRHVTYVTPERTVGIDVGTLNYANYQAEFDKYGVDFKLGRRVSSVERLPNKALMVELSGESGHVIERLEFDHVYYSGGTWPNSSLYDALREHSSNRGRIDQEAFIAARAQPQYDRSGFQLYRIGDAVSSRNVHAALLDAQRIALGI